MLFNLIYKDILLIKHHIIFIILLTIIIPVFFSSTSELNGGFVFSLTSIFVVLSIYQDVSIEEEKYPNATMLLCSLPIGRELLVLARYLLAIFAYIYCSIICFLVTAIMKKNISDNYSLISLSVFLLFLILGIGIPLQFRFGYGIVKYVFSIACVSIPFILPHLTLINVNMNRTTIVNIVIVTISCIIYYISYLISCRIIKKKEF